MLATLVCVVFLGFPGESPAGTVVGLMEAPALEEISGIVRSRKYPGIFWVHGDSGNPPLLHAIRADGRLVQSYPVAAPNLDWEDIAADDEGNLYLGDIGNNLGLLPIRAIHRLAEPDPNQPPADPIPVTTFRYRFDGPAFDAESLVIDGDRAFVITKRHDGLPAEIRAVALSPGKTLLVKPSEVLGELPGFSEAITGADLSRDGQRLAVCSTRRAAVFKRGPRGWTLLGAVLHGGKDVEAIAWDGEDLLLAGENRELYRVPARAWSQPQR